MADNYVMTPYTETDEDRAEDARRLAAQEAAIAAEPLASVRLMRSIALYGERLARAARRDGVHAPIYGAYESAAYSAKMAAYANQFGYLMDEADGMRAWAGSLQVDAMNLEANARHLPDSSNRDRMLAHAAEERERARIHMATARLFEYAAYLVGQETGTY